MASLVLKIIYMIGLILGMVVRIIGIRWSGYERKKGGPQDTIEGMLLLLVFIGMQVLPLIFVFSSWLGFADFELPLWLNVIFGLMGTVIFALANWLIWRSHTDLGKSFSPKVEIHEQQSLVTQGIFRRIRHPMYSGHLFWSIAQMLLLHNWIAGPAMLVSTIPFYMYRIPREEQMMQEEFGEEYQEYMKKTGRFFPTK